MKITKLYAAFSLIVLGNLGQAQSKIEPYVDERVELLSSIFRLIEADEYSDKNNALYVEDIKNTLGLLRIRNFLRSLKKSVMKMVWVMMR